MVAIGLGDEGVAAQCGVAFCKAGGSFPEGSRGADGGEASIGEVPAVFVVLEEAAFDEAVLVGVGGEGERTELVGDEVVAGLGLPFAGVEEEELLKVCVLHGAGAGVGECEE